MAYLLIYLPYIEEEGNQKLFEGLYVDFLLFTLLYKLYIQTLKLLTRGDSASPRNRAKCKKKSNGSSNAGNGHRRVTEAVKQPVLISIPAFRSEVVYFTSMVRH